jgi:hypothetical protein
MATSVSGLLAVLLAAVEVGSGFGAASASTVEFNDGSVVVEIQVEVTVTAEAVIVHLVTSDQEEITLPLVNRGGSRFGVVTEVAPKDYAVVFEIIGPEGALSDPVTLSSLGADLGSGVAVPPVVGDGDDGLSPDTRNWGWLGLALAAASLSALAFWTLGARDRKTRSGGDEGEEE